MESLKNGKSSRESFYKPLGPALLLFGLIFLFSSTPYALQNLRPLLAGDRVVEWLNLIFAGMSFEYDGKIISTFTMGTPAVAEFFLRKFAHFLLYCALSICLMFTLNRLTTWSIAIRALVALTLAAGYAMFDELYQGFIPQRTSSLADVWVDLTGALLGIVLFLIWKRRDRDAKS